VVDVLGSARIEKCRMPWPPGRDLGLRPTVPVVSTVVGRSIAVQVPPWSSLKPMYWGWPFSSTPMYTRPSFATAISLLLLVAVVMVAWRPPALGSFWDTLTQFAPVSSLRKRPMPSTAA
jgi:hypothetical protein